MPDLDAQLREILQGRVCLVGVGNADGGDDAFGVRLAETLRGRAAVRSPPPSPAAPGRAPLQLRIIIAGTNPERDLAAIAAGRFDHVVFVDAVDCGGPPGAVVLLDTAEMVTRFPQVSTHRLSLGLLAQLLQANGHTRAWLVGVQPESLRPGRQLSHAVQTTLGLLIELLRGILVDAHPAQEATLVCA